MPTHCDLCDQAVSLEKQYGGIVFDRYKKEALDGWFIACNECAKQHEEMFRRAKDLGVGSIGVDHARQMAERYLIVTSKILKARKKKK
jgi:hypothetical protein